MVPMIFNITVFDAKVLPFIMTMINNRSFFHLLKHQEKREAHNLSPSSYLAVVPHAQLSPHKQGLQEQPDS